jgi:hypothetical protein
MTAEIRKELEAICAYVHAERCKCQPVNGAKCFDDSCINRSLSIECTEECGEGCLNGPEARKVSQSVELFSVPFGYGLRAKEAIPKVWL